MLKEFLDGLKHHVATLPGWPQAPGLTLDLDQRSLRFRSPREFDFALAARTAVPGARLQTLYGLDPARLRAESQCLARLDQQLLVVRDEFLHRGISLRSTLQTAGTVMISGDHHWRGIFDQLIDGDCREAYLLCAINRYLAYLRQRQDVIRSLLRLAEECRPAAEQVTQVWTAPVAPLPRAPSASAAALNRLPRGEAVRLRLRQGQSLAIRLARHAFALCHEHDWALIGANGQRYVLRAGLNSVGRSRTNSVAVDSGLKNVSRRHLLAELLDHDQIMLTDVSSAGTWIAPDTATA